MYIHPGMWIGTGYIQSYDSASFISGLFPTLVPTAFAHGMGLCSLMMGRGPNVFLSVSHFCDTLRSKNLPTGQTIDWVLEPWVPLESELCPQGPLAAKT